MKKQDTKDAQSSKIHKEDYGEVINVKEGTLLTMNGIDYVFDKGELVPIEKKEENEKPHFYVWFDKRQVEWGRQTSIEEKQINGLDIVVSGKLVGIDIYPILVDLFGSRNGITIHAYKGIQYGTGDREGTAIHPVETSLSLNSTELAHLKNEFCRMFDMSIVNKNQLDSYKRHVDSVFSGFFRDFWTML